MNKSELVTAIAKEAEIKKDLAHRTLDATVTTITKALKKGDAVQNSDGNGLYQGQHVE